MANSFYNYQLLDECKQLDDASSTISFDKQAISIHKFGGTSLASKQALLNVTSIIANKTANEDLIVVSANGKVTDWLIDFSNGNPLALSKIKNYYLGLVADTLNNPSRFLTEFNHDIIQLEKNIFAKDDILAFGELWSAQLLVVLLKQLDIPALFIDAREVLRTDSIDNFKCFDINHFDQAIEKIIYGNFSKRLIVTGFIAKNLAGKTITLGRNGSDYTASLLANLTHAKKVVLWTDVKGIYDADPNLIQSAQPIDHLSFIEAQALASVGTNVLHNKTIAPLLERQIPLFVRSSLEPDYCGTCISHSNLYSSNTEKNIHINQTKSIAIKQELVSLTLKNNIHINHHAILDSLSNAGIFNLKTNYNSNTKNLSLLIEQSSLNETIQLLTETQIEFNIDKEKLCLVAIVGKEIGYQKSFLLILQKILSIQYQFKTIHNNSSDLFLLYTEEKDCLAFFELIYHCCTSEDFYHQASFTFPSSLIGDYSLFEPNHLAVSEVIQ